MGPNGDIHLERGRAESFGSVAVAYDAHRPSYPSSLIDWIGEAFAPANADTGGPLGRALDVGCGTGQAARLLQAAGWDVTGVEIDDRMADVGRSHGLDIRTSRFEAWTSGSPFDLICSAQAWHWIDPAIRFERAAELLRPGGRLVTFWSMYDYDDAVNDVVSAVVPRHAAALLKNSVHFGTMNNDYDALDQGDLVDSAPWFHPPVIETFHHDRHQSVDDWVAEAVTHSPMALTPESVRSPLLADLALALAAIAGDGIHVHHSTRACMFVRR